MAIPWRIEYEGAYYHVFSRGNEGRDIFYDDKDRRLTLRDPKSGREQEFIFIPQRVADRLKDYIRQKDIQPNQRIFPICYEAAREMVAKAGSVVCASISGHMI